jgi:hypothetical protein
MCTTIFAEHSCSPTHSAAGEGFWCLEQINLCAAGKAEKAVCADARSEANAVILDSNDPWQIEIKDQGCWECEWGSDHVPVKWQDVMYDDLEAAMNAEG